MNTSVSTRNYGAMNSSYNIDRRRQKALRIHERQEKAHEKSIKQEEFFAAARREQGNNNNSNASALSRTAQNKMYNFSMMSFQPNLLKMGRPNNLSRSHKIDDSSIEETEQTLSQFLPEGLQKKITDIKQGFSGSDSENSDGYQEQKKQLEDIFNDEKLEPAEKFIAFYELEKYLTENQLEGANGSINNYIKQFLDDNTSIKGLIDEQISEIKSKLHSSSTIKPNLMFKHYDMAQKFLSQFPKYHLTDYLKDIATFTLFTASDIINCLNGLKKTIVSLMSKKFSEAKNQSHSLLYIVRHINQVISSYNILLKNSKNVINIISDLVVVMKLCEKNLIAESDVNNLTKALNIENLHKLYNIISQLPLNTVKLKDVINRMKSMQESKNVSSRSEKNNLSVKTGVEHRTKQEQYKKLIVSEKPSQIARKRLAAAA
ncbi:MAG: hypothetical protein PHC75_06120 [Burkholderiales bacterium]|nr:hypothetical protein [Burkholderiales bacterium]